MGEEPLFSYFLRHSMFLCQIYFPLLSELDNLRLSNPNKLDSSPIL
jgi:hypothetical protein